MSTITPDLLALDALKGLIRAYVRLLESGRDRIIELGGDCDPVDVMEKNNPFLKEARKAIAALEAANKTQWAMCPETYTPCKTCPTLGIPCEAAKVAQPTGHSKEWCMKMAALEGDSEIGVGAQPVVPQSPVCQFVKAPMGNYPQLVWADGYKAKIGDKFYAAPAPLVEPMQTNFKEKSMNTSLPEASPETKGICNTERACSACYSGQGDCEVATAAPDVELPVVAWQSRFLNMSDESEGWSSWKNVDPLDVEIWKHRCIENPAYYELRGLIVQAAIAAQCKPVHWEESQK